MGYFWIPCRKCGDFYGGHEPHSSYVEYKGWWKSIGVLEAEKMFVICPLCVSREYEALKSEIDEIGG